MSYTATTPYGALIQVVEDQPSQQALMCLNLEIEGLRFITAANGEETINIEFRL